MNCTDKMIQYVYEYLQSRVGARWHDFQEVGLDEPYYDFYYAEDMLYIIRDRLMETYYFTRARSPKEALDAFKERAHDVAMAGATWREDED